MILWGKVESDLRQDFRVIKLRLMGDVSHIAGVTKILFNCDD